ncbi:GNAT family N-acetyltransferase [Nocardia alba]|uniref:GNAT family N-acetyltransferase n=1 Tax=Nocardia alba TaxID=225051 RepID=UPI001A9D99E6|nr:GNAT family N-acetyltransferase [Nocardia alba]
MTVRPRTQLDLDECARLLVEVHERDGYPVEGVADPVSWLTPTTLVRAWAAELTGSVVGHALVTRPTPSDDAATMWIEHGSGVEADLLVFGRLFVGSAGRNQGVGTLLVHTAMTYAKAQGKTLVLDVMEKDQAAIRLYERLGWRNIGSAVHRFGDNQQTTAQCYVAPS